MIVDPPKATKAPKTLQLESLPFPYTKIIDLGLCEGSLSVNDGPFTRSLSRGTPDFQMRVALSCDRYGYFELRVYT